MAPRFPEPAFFDRDPPVDDGRDETIYFARSSRPRPSQLPNQVHSLEELRAEEEIKYRAFLGKQLENREFIQEAQVDLQGVGGQSPEGSVPPEVVELRQEVILSSNASASENFNASDAAEAGGFLKEMADDFAKSLEGRRVRERADNIPLSSITEERFNNLLRQMFPEGVGREHLILLFSFFSRVLIRALEASAYTLAMNLFRWSLEYIRNQVVQWIYQGDK